MKFIYWLRNGIDGDDGRPSHRKLTTLAMVLMAAFMIFANKIQTTIHLHAFYALLTVICILIGVVTIADVLKFFGRGGSDKDELMTGVPVSTSSNIKPGDEINLTVNEVKPS